MSAVGSRTDSTHTSPFGPFMTHSATQSGAKSSSAAVSSRSEACYHSGRKHGRSWAVKRRDFITLLGGAAAAWPLAAHAQQGEQTRRIGVLVSGAADNPDVQVWLAAFLQRLLALGWSEGRNLRIEYRLGGLGDAERTRKYAAELVALAPDVIFASGTAQVGPLLQATRTVPIIFAIVADPVGGGFVDSLARPGGNATGFG